MTNSPPKDGEVNDTWISDVGELYRWDGEKWELEAQKNDIRLNDAGELRYWDGKDWALYEDPPEWPGGDPDPKWLYRDTK